MIKLAFFGAAGEVTGSCYVITTDRARVMVDFGMHQGELEADEHNHRMPDVDPATIDAVVLTHAHLDHCGRLPLLAKARWQRRIHCTPATADLTGIILRDSAELQVADATRFNAKLRRPGQAPAEPLYTPEDVERTLPLLTPARYGEPVRIAEGIAVKFVDAGHILGAASVLMTINDGPRTVNIAFSGDVGVTGSPILRDPTPPTPADVVLLESTYGDRDHRSLESTTEQLLEILKGAQRTCARVLIPAFAVGRTQDLIFHMGEFVRRGQLERLNVYVDSPMAVETSDLYARYKDLYDARALELLQEHLSPLKFPSLRYVRSVEESKRLNALNECAVVIAASGMCTGGRILHHLYHHLPKPETEVVIVGYQGQGTLGRKLVDGARRVRIFGDEVLVRAKINTLGGFSAHAGQSGLVQWAAAYEKARPKLFLTHGEDGPRQTLAGVLKARLGMDAGMPKYGDEVTL